MFFKASRTYSRDIWLTVAMTIAMAIAFGAYVKSEKQIDRANDMRQISFVLSDQLRQSSDELTRMARAYVVTGDTRYKQYYQDILAIRDGRKPQPHEYTHVYWDLVLADGQAGQAGSSQAIALLEQMRQAGFSAEELDKLAAAKANSDSLSSIELEAMRLAEGVGPGVPAKRAKALQLMHDADYHRAKAAIMRPINQSFELMDRRTAEQVRDAESTATRFRIVFILFVLAALFMLWRTYTNLRAILGAPAEEVHSHIRKIGRGDLSGEIHVAPNMAESVLAGLADMQARLKVIRRESQQAETALRTGAERLNEAQRLARIGSWELNLVSGQLIWSDEIFRLFEIDPDRFGATYEAFLNAVHPEDRDAVNQAYTDSLANREPYQITHRLLLADGRIKWVQERGESDFDATGKPFRSVGTVQDITAQKLADAELRIAATVFDSQEGMMVTDAQRVILRVNRAFTEITGYAAEEVVGRTPRMLQSGRHDQSFYRAMWETIQRTGFWQGEVWDRRKNGEVYPKWLAISSVKGEDGVVTHYVGTHFDITERKLAEEKINDLAFYDQLTNLPNRTLLLDRLKQTMVSSARSSSYGALLFIDLDNFKTINDTQGHDIGDLLLKQVAQRLKSCVREGDTVARLGGDEFVVVLAGLSVDQEAAATDIEYVAEKIIDTLNRSYYLGNLAHYSTASIGVTLFKGDGTSVDDLMKQADLAMYKSKEAGRNTVRFFDPKMESAVKERVSLEEDLRQAIEQKQFLLHYQAQVAGGRLSGAEVLVRWQHPQRGVVSPANFIPLAEETGLILALGRWVLETACRQLAVWTRQPEMAELTVAVNVSAHQFRQPDFVDQVLAVLNSTGANPQRLKLELTESLLVHNVEDIIEKMFALKAKGVGFALDDFGTGYSSLSYLKRLPLDQLKIDQSFVRDVLSDPNDAAIARTVVALAQSLGLGVIAEGVETELQRDFLASSGCHAYQGYFFSRPLPIEDFEMFARQA
ncbi:MAG: EAL domain-containing protein [Betaproteobacteria bacterium]|nr:EAL domain-containing protein [Betaproteobacteria bacterium]